MLPLVDKPGIQYVVEEAVRAGITDVLIVTGRSKKTVEDHFDRSPELEASLERSGKLDLLAEMQAIATMADVHFVRQHEPRGLGHAVGMARHHVGDEPFAVLLPDDLMAEDSTVLADMVAAHERTGASVLALKRFGPEEISAYGAIEPAGPVDEHGLVPIAGMVEKPRPGEAPSDLAILGRYVLSPRSSTASSASSPAPAASCSSPMPCAMLVALGWPVLRARPSRAGATTPATSSTGCGPRSRSRCSTPRSARASARR